jgi:hypothetical protein
VLDLEFFHKLNMIVVCDNLFVMHAEILRQNIQQGILNFLKVNIELLSCSWLKLSKSRRGLQVRPHQYFEGSKDSEV